MALTLNTITLFLILSIISLTNATEESEWKTHKLISKDGWSGQNDEFNDPIFVYNLCKDEPIAKSKRECMIILYENVHINTTKPKQCKFTLDNASNGIIRIQQFGSDRVIFVWSDETKKNENLHWTFRMAVIQISTCKIYPTELVLQITNKDWKYNDDMWHADRIGILSYESTFDVIVKGVEACGDASDDNHCVYTYNSDGKLIGGPFTRFSPFDDNHSYQFRTSSRRSPDDGYLVNAMSEEYMNVFHIKPTGKSKDEAVTKLLWKFTFSQKGLPITSYAWNNEMILICGCPSISDKLSCDCVQMDQEGKSKKQMKIVMSKSSNAVPLLNIMHNLRGGGFLFVTFYSYDKKYVYSMAKVNSDGRIIGEPIVIANHAKTCTPDFVSTRWIEQDDGQYCITFACVQKNMMERTLKTLTKCYTLNLLDSKLHIKNHMEL